MALNVVADISAKVNQQSMSSALASMKTQFQGLGVDLKVNIPDLTKNANGFRQVADSVDRTTDSIRKFGEQSGIATKRLLAYSAAVAAILGPINLLRNAVEEAVKFQREIVRVAQVAGDTKTELKGLQDQITNLAKSYGVSSLELIKAATVFRQAGFNARETADSIEVLAKALLAPNFDNGTQIAETIVALKSQFKDAVRDAKTLQDTIGGLNAVAGGFAVEAKDLEEAIKRTGGAFAAAGGNVNELVALFTSVRATTRESAETIATSFRTIFARLQRADIVDQLKSFGIELRRTREEANALGDAKLEGQFVGAYEAIRRLSAAVKDLPTTDPRFAAIAEEIGGYRQLSKTIPLLQQFATAQEALNVAQSGAASLNINAAQAQDAYTVKLQKLKEQLFELGRSIVNSQGFASFFKVLESGASSVLKLVDALTPLIPLLSILATAKLATGFRSLISGFSGGVTSTLDTQGRPIRRAGGGSVPGSGIGDTVPAMLTPGEYVLRKEAVARIGVGTLNAMNAGKPQGYANGGLVQYFADGGRVEKAVADVESGKAIATAAKNANVGIRDLVKTLFEAGKLSAEGYASLSPKTREYADSLKAAAKSVQEAATVVKAAAPATPVGENLAGKKTTQRSLFAEPDILGPVGGLLPASGTGRRGQFQFTQTSLPVEAEPGLAPLPAGVRSSREKNIPLNGNTTLSSLDNLTVNRIVNGPPVAKPAPKPDILAGIENARLQGEQPSGSGEIKELIPNRTFAQQARLLRKLNEETNLRPGTNDDESFGRLARNFPEPLTRNAPATKASKFGAREDAAVAFLGGATTDQSFKTPLNSLADSVFASGRKRKFSAQVLGNLTDAEREEFNGLDEAGQRKLFGQKLKEQREFNSRARDSRRFFANKFEQDAIGPDGKKTDFFLGSERSIEPLQQPGFFGNALSKAGSFAGGRLGAAGNFFKRNFTTVGLGAAFLGVNALNDSIGNSAITAEKAAQGAGVGIKQFTQQEGIRGGLTGAQLGAGAGAAFGPFGIAIGAAIGGVLGFVDGLQDAAKKIAQVKLDESLTKLKTEIDDAAAGKIGSSATDVNFLLADAKSKSFENTNKQLETSTSNKLLRGFSFGLFGDKEATPEERARAQQENFKNQIGLQLPQLNQIAGRQASDFAKNRADSIGGSINGLGLSVEGARFAEQFKSANGELIKDIALIKGISVDKVVKEFQKQFEDQVKALSIAKGRSNARAQSENILNSIDRLSKAFDAAAEAANNTAKANTILTDVFGGSASAIQTRNLSGGIANLGVAGATAQAGFKSSFGVIDNLVGSQPLRETALGLNQAKQVLPDALVNSLKSNPTGGDNFIVRLRSELSTVPKAIQDSIVTKLESLDTAKLAEKLKESGEKLADELLQDFNPVKDALAKIANDVTANSNAFIAGLAQAGRNQGQVDAARGRVDNIALDRQRLAAEFTVANNRRNNSSSTLGVTDILTEGQALNPFREGQRRLLTGNRFINQERLNIDAQFGRAGISEDADVLSGAFNQAQAESKRLLAVREKNPTDAKAIENFNNVQQQANNIAQAMKNAAENTDGLRRAQERLADITDKLGRFQQSRQAAGDLNKRVFRAQTSFDFQELRNINQGRQGAEFLRRGGNIGDLQRFNPELARNTLDFAEANRNLIVGGKTIKRDADGNAIRDKRGNIVREDNKNATLGQLIDEQFNPQGKSADEKALQAELKKEQEKALKEKERQESNAKAYATILDKSNTDFVNNLRDAFNLFGTLVKEQKDALERNVVGGQLRAAETEKASFEGTAVVAKNELGALGITTQAQLDTIKGASPDLARIATLKKQQDELENQRQQTIIGATPGIDRFGADLKNDAQTKKVAKALLGGADKTGVEFSPEFQTKINTAIQNGGGDASTNAEISRRFQKQLIDTATRVPLDKINIGQVLKDATDITFAGKQDAVGNQLSVQQKRTGENLRRGGLQNVANDLVKNPEKAQQILDASTKIGGSLDDVNKRLIDFNERIKILTTTFDAIGKGAPPVQNRAMGGPIFSPRGTDTVPAMLTPGEFVVRASSTRNNMALLNKINNSSGPVYAATGGVVPGGNTGGVSFDSTGMKAAFDSFVSGTQALVSAMNAFPREITGNFTHRVEVIHNGIAEIVNLDSKISEAILAKVEKRFEDFGNSLRSQGFRV